MLGSILNQNTIGALQTILSGVGGGGILFPEDNVMGLWGGGIADDCVSIIDTSASGSDRDARQGQSLDYNGTTDYVEIPDDASLDFGDGVSDQPFSISAWINMDDATLFAILSKGDATNNAEYDFKTTGVDQLQLNLLDLTTGNTIGARLDAITAYEGSFIFVVATYDGNGSESGINLYAYSEDGTLIQSTVAQFASGVYVAMEGGINSLKIGRRYATSDYANGQIFDVRIHNTELTSQQIEDVFRGKLSGSEVGHWKTDEETGGKLYDSSGNDNHGTINGSPIWTRQNVVSFPNKEGFTISDGATYYEDDGGLTLIPVDVIIPNLDTDNTKSVAYTVGGVRADSENFGDGPIHGALVQSNCATFNGISDFINLGDKIKASNSLVVGAWINLDAIGSIEYIASKGIGYVGFREWELRVDASGTVTFQLYDESELSGFEKTSTTVLSPTTWYHVVGIYNGIDMRVIINGVDEGTPNVTSPLIDNNGITTRIGSRSAGVAFFGGKIAGFFASLDVATPSDILSIYNKGGKPNDILNLDTYLPLAEGEALKAFDASGNGNHGDITGTASAIWANTQDVYHYNVTQGFNLYNNGSNDVRVPEGIDANALYGWTLVSNNPSGAWWNDPETKWKPNPLGAPGPIRAALVDENTVYTDYVNRFNEFLNNEDPIKVTNYLLYENWITTAQSEQIVDSQGTWTPAKLQSIMRVGFETYDGAIDGIRNGGVSHESGSVSAWINSKFSDIDVTDYAEVDNSGGEPVDVFVDNLDGSFDVVKNTLLTHSKIKISTVGLENLDTYKVTFDVQVNSGNFWVGHDNDGTGIMNHAKEVTASGSYKFYITINSATAGQDLYLGAQVISETFDIVLSNIKVTRVAQKAFGQDTLSNEPDYNESAILSAREITFNGSDHFLDGSDHIGDFTSDSQGEMVFVVKRDVDAGQYIIVFGNITDTNRLALLISSAGLVQIFHDAAAVWDSTKNIDDLDYHIISVSSDGTSYKIVVDGIEHTIDSGFDDGNWLSDLTTTSINIAISAWLQSVPVYSSTSQKAEFYFNRQLTNVERGKLFDYLNNRYRVY
jgi:hypothetical protein